VELRHRPSCRGAMERGGNDTARRFHLTEDDSVREAGGVTEMDTDGKSEKHLDGS